MIWWFLEQPVTQESSQPNISPKVSLHLRWALAGRSASKLEAVAAECKTFNPDRIQPGIEICQLNDEDLSALAKKTKVLITTVGPYGLYGEHAFKACAENGTHYLDATGEVPYVAKMIQKYESAAKASGALMFPQIAIESAPPDVITWLLVKMIKERFSAPTGEVVISQELVSAPSGGTLLTVFSILDAFTIKEITSSLKPYAISPVPGPSTKSPVSLLTKLLGVRTVRDLGLLTTSLAGTSDAAIVHRSWGLQSYGPNFHFSEYMKARNYLTGTFFHFALLMGSLLLAIPPFRAWLRGGSINLERDRQGNSIGMIGLSIRGLLRRMWRGRRALGLLLERLGMGVCMLLLGCRLLRRLRRF